MQFISLTGDYREYRGYVFVGRKPVAINDKATETLLLLNKEFRKVEDEKPRTEGIQEAKAEREEEKIVTKNKGGRPKGSKNRKAH